MAAHCYNDSWLCFQGPEQQSSADLSQPALDPTTTHTYIYLIIHLFSVSFDFTTFT